MNTKHTPGPWVRESGILVLSAFEKTPNGSKRLTVCRTDNPHMGEQEQGANARLIAAAPELLRVAEKIDEEWHLAHDALKAKDHNKLFIYLCSWQDTARAAIAKATQ